MKAGWEVKTLDDVAYVIAGQSPEGSFYNIKMNGDGYINYDIKYRMGRGSEEEDQ